MPSRPLTEEERLESMGVPLQEDLNVPEPSITAGQITGSAATEITGNVLGEIITQVISAKVPKPAKIAVKRLGRFLSGAGSSGLAQQIEGKEDLSFGRMIAAGTVNNMLTKVKAPLIDPVKRDVAKSAFFAGSERYLADAIDEQEFNPLRLDVAIAAATGGAIGVPVGRAQYKFSDADKVATLIGKNADEIDEIIGKGEVGKNDLNALLQDAVGRPITQKELDRTSERMIRERTAQALQSSQRPLPRMISEVKSFIAPTLALKGVRNVRENYLNFADRLQSAEALSTRLQNAIDKVTVSKPHLAQDIDDYLNGAPLSEALMNEGIAGDLQSFRSLETEALTELHDLLKNSDELEFLDKESKQAVLYRLEQVISRKHRSFDTAQYKAFTNKEFTQNKVTEDEVQEEVFDSLIMQGLDEKKAASKAKQHLSHIKSLFVKAKDKGTGRTKQAELLVSLPGRFEKVIGGHAPGPKERLFLGEIDQPFLSNGLKARFRIRDSIRHVANIESDIKLKQGLEEAGLLSKTKTQESIEFSPKYTQGTDADGNQLYIPYEVGVAINRLYETGFTRQAADEASNTLAQIYGIGVTGSKAAKVIFNPPSYMVNFFSGQASMLSNGIIPNVGKTYLKGANLAFKEIHSLYNSGAALSKGQKKISDPEIRRRISNDMAEMYKYGIGNATIAANEVADAINNGKLGDFARGLTAGAGKLYSVTDTATRFTIWKFNQKKLTQILKRKGNPLNISRDQIKRIAAEITNDTYQNYARTWSLGRKLSRAGILPPFVTFTLEFARNTANQVSYARRMINGDAFAQKFGITIDDASRAALREEGFKRLGYLAGTMFLAAGAASGVGSAIGAISENAGDRVDPRDMESFRFFSPSYMRNQDIIATYNPKTKLGTSAATSYLLPHTMFTGLIKAAYAEIQNPFTEDDAEKNVQSALGLVVDNFVGEGTFIGQNLYRALDNRDVYGKVITDKEGAAKFGALLKEFAFETFRPGFINEGSKFLKAFQGLGDYSMLEIGMRQVGARLTKVDFNQMAKFRVQEFVQGYSNARGRYTTDAKYKSDQLSENELEQSYRRAVKQAEASYNRISESFDRLKAFGYTEEERINVLREAGVRSTDVFRIVSGMDFQPFQRGVQKTTGEQYSEIAEGKSRAETLAEIRELRRGDAKSRFLAESLEREHNRRINDEKRGRTPQDKLLMNMSILERVRVLRDIGAHRNSAMFYEFKRKGVINKEVAKLLRSL
tara:strand:+ start:692 stop:4402 length:3711 start_codon:yes stop_codon:yes gene_type:complete